MAVPTPDSATICVYPLSPSYLPLHRYLFYASLIISVLYPTPPPLIKGAFAFSLIFSSTAALYAFLIISQPSPATLNLDIFGLWSILSPATIAVLPLLSWNKNLHSTNGRSSRLIVRFWGILVVAATICTFILVKNAETSTSKTCSTDNSKIKLRNPRDAELILVSSIFHQLFSLVKRLSSLVFMSAAFGLITCIVDVSPPNKKSDFRPEIIGDDAPMRNYSPLRTIGGAFDQLCILVAALTPLVFISVVVVNEMFLLKDGGIVGMEKLYEIGQWGLYVGLGFVALAALVDELVGKKKKVVTEFSLRGGTSDIYQVR